MGAFGVYLLTAALAPWTFLYGGHFHATPGWAGAGVIHAPAAGGDYYLWLRLDATIPGYRKSEIKGSAVLCTPKGVRYRMSLSGGLQRGHGANTIGTPITLGMMNWPLLYGGLLTRNTPSIGFSGRFGDRELVLDDRGSVARAFDASGIAWAPGQHSRPWKQPSSSVTLREVTMWTTEPSCPARPY